MYVTTRSHPVLIAVAAGLWTVGLLALVARLIHAYTRYDLAEPFATAALVLSIACTAAGWVLAGWLIMRTRNQQIRVLRAENVWLRAEKLELEQILQAVRDADAQVEVNGVRLTKLLKLLEERALVDADTQPIARLHSINGRGGA